MFTIYIAQISIVYDQVRFTTLTIYAITSVPSILLSLFSLIIYPNPPCQQINSAVIVT